MKQWVERRQERKKTTSLPTEQLYRIDQSRIINSMAFRRLQAKTQVHGVGESDFFRTRLTHSMEVAQIGNSITHRMIYLATQSRNKHTGVQDWIPPIPLIETICLAHDLGHPAFGHNGERTLNYFLHGAGGFEGNGQTFRILTKLGEYSSQNGYNLTRRALLGVVKYPALHRDYKKAYPVSEDDSSIDISNWSPPKCLHDSESEELDWVLSPLCDRDKELFTSIEFSGKKPKTIYHSFDASIMECADDIAYGVHDLEAALVMGLLHNEQVCEELSLQLEELSSYYSQRWSFPNRHYLIQKLSSGKLEETKTAISIIISTLVNGTNIVRQDKFESPLLDFQCQMSSDRAEILNDLKGYVYENVIAQPSVQTLEYKGQKIIADLFTALHSKPKALLPKIVYQKIDESTPVERVIADYLSSMTDTEACRLYQRLFTPEKGSIFSPLI